MKPLKILLVTVIFSLFLFACRKKNCATPVPVKTDELSNTIWLGAYGREYPEYRQLDTLIMLEFRSDGFINVYEKDKTSGLKGKGFYTFDGKNFEATISFFKTGIPYLFSGVRNAEKTILSGAIHYDSNNTNGAFEVVPLPSL